MDTCTTCGFDVAEWNDQDTERTIATTASLVAAWTVGLDGGVLEPLQALVQRSTDADAPLGPDREFVHELFHQLAETAAARVVAGDGLDPQRGSVAQVNASGGGVPKRAIDEADVGRRGVRSDVQKTRRFHGRPWQALCLWSTEVIDELAAEGHAIFAGAAGENMTLTGIDWESLRGGSILAIGDVQCQLSVPSEPCSQLAAWFIDGNFNRINDARHPGDSRWYASVLKPGTIRPGDVARIIS